jgi:hypothetical protein
MSCGCNKKKDNKELIKRAKDKEASSKPKPNVNKMPLVSASKPALIKKK